MDLSCDDNLELVNRLMYDKHEKHSFSMICDLYLLLSELNGNIEIDVTSKTTVEEKEMAVRNILNFAGVDVNNDNKADIFKKVYNEIDKVGSPNYDKISFYQTINTKMKGLSDNLMLNATTILNYGEPKFKWVIPKGELELYGLEYGEIRIINTATEETQYAPLSELEKTDAYLFTAFDRNNINKALRSFDVRFLNY